MERQPLPDHICFVAGIEEEITRDNRIRLLPRYVAAKQLIIDEGTCPNRDDEICNPCKLYGPGDRMCDRYKAAAELIKHAQAGKTTL